MSPNLWAIKPFATKLTLPFPFLMQDQNTFSTFDLDQVASTPTLYSLDEQYSLRFELLTRGVGFRRQTHNAKSRIRAQLPIQRGNDRVARNVCPLLHLLSAVSFLVTGFWRKVGATCLFARLGRSRTLLSHARAFAFRWIQTVRIVGFH